MKIPKYLLLTLVVWSLLVSPCWAYYDTDTGTFITRDPAGMVDGPNPYTYVKQNPWTKFDPEGLAGEWALGMSDQYASQLRQGGGVGNFLGASIFGAIGSIQKGIGDSVHVARVELPQDIQQQKARIAQAEASGKMDGTFVAVNRLALGFVQGSTEAASLPVNLDKIPGAIAGLGPKIGTDAAQMIDNPSVSKASDLIEDATAVMALTKLATSAASLKPTGSATDAVPPPGTPVFRLWGGKSGPWGQSWTTADPRKIPDFREQAGLPDSNTGRFISEGVLKDTTGVKQTTATPLDGNKGGLTETVIPNAAKQVELKNVQGVNPEM